MEWKKREDCAIVSSNPLYLMVPTMSDNSAQANAPTVNDQDARQLCLYCDHENAYDALSCESCESSLLVGYLESEGEGVIPQGLLFPLCRRSYRVGRRMSDDYVIPCHSANSILLEYMGDDTFRLHPPSPKGFCLLNDQPFESGKSLVAGDSIRLGADLFTFFEGDPPEGTTIFSAQTAQQAQFILHGAYMEIAAAADLNSACEVAVDAVLKITKMDRGVFFLTDTDEAGELVLRQCVTRETTFGEGFTDVDSPFKISQTLLQQSLLDGGTIIIDDARKRTTLPHSMVALNLNSLACIPIVYSERRLYSIEDCIGIIYTDSFMPTREIEPHVVPLLTMLASFLSTTIMNWR